jgi:hypothetical protein
VGIEPGRAAPAQRRRSWCHWRLGDAGFAGSELALAQRSMVDAIQSLGLDFLRSAGVAGRERPRDFGRRRASRFHDRLPGRSFRSGLRWRAAKAPDGSAGHSRWSYMAGAGECSTLGPDKSSGTAVFAPAGDVVIVCAVRRVPGLPLETCWRRFSLIAQSTRGRGWGRMTVSVAGRSTAVRSLCEALFLATEFGGGTSKNNRRRVERNPV